MSQVFPFLKFYHHFVNKSFCRLTRSVVLDMDLCNMAPSANSPTLEKILYGYSLMNIGKRVGPNTDPWWLLITFYPGLIFSHQLQHLESSHWWSSWSSSKLFHAFHKHESLGAGVDAVLYQMRSQSRGKWHLFDHTCWVHHKGLWVVTMGCISHAAFSKTFLGIWNHINALEVIGFCWPHNLLR